MNSSFPAVENEQTEIDLAPMLDIVFIMLIFFVVTASFIKEAGVPFAMLPPSPLPPENVEVIVVVVEPAGVFNVNGRFLERDSLRPYVQALHAENPDAPYSVLVMKQSRVGDTVAAIDAGRLIGVEVVPIARAGQVEGR
jgi:biopolymer transport protein ExbD